MYKYFFKRLFDFLFAFIFGVISLPIFLGVAMLIRLKLPGNSVFFVQSRIGRKNKIFKIYKFRTMTEQRDQKGNLLPDKDRLTNIGKFIRSTSLDEIPQLINVLRGDMSLIGPRPLLVEYLPLYNEEQIRRHEVRPGITGWAQINGRNTLTWEQRFEYDVWYVNNLSVKLDVKILFMTIRKVLIREGINSSTQTTMKRFTGNKSV